MPLDFPPSPSVGTIYSFGGNSWRWNGYAWESYSAAGVSTYVETLNGLSGAVAISGSGDLGVTVTGQSIVLSVDVGTLTANVEVASSTTAGIASFDSNTFTISGTGHVAVKTGIVAGTLIVLGQSGIFGTGNTGALPSLDGSALTGVDAKYLQGKTPRQLTDGGVF